MSLTFSLGTNLEFVDVDNVLCLRYNHRAVFEDRGDHSSFTQVQITQVTITSRDMPGFKSVGRFENYRVVMDLALFGPGAIATFYYPSGIACQIPIV